MKKRYLISAGIMAAGVGIGLGVLAMLPPSPGVTKANFDRIREGMTLAEVEEIFGRKGEELPVLPVGTLIWNADDGSQAHIEFVDDCAAPLQWFDSNETISNKIRRWFRLADDPAEVEPAEPPLVDDPAEPPS